MAREQVIGSIIMFGLIYLLLVAVWLFVLNHKIQHGPEEPEPGGSAPEDHGFLQSAAQIAGHQSSYTEAHGETR